MPREIVQRPSGATCAGAPRNEPYDDRYARYAVPKAPVLASDLPGCLTAEAERQAEGRVVGSY